MDHNFKWLVAACLSLVSATIVAAHAQQESTSPTCAADEKKDESIDFERARKLMKRRQGGEKLTADEDACLKRAMEARRKGAPQSDGQQQANRTPRETAGLKPLTEMTADDRYQSQDGGLYGDGENSPPEGHVRAAEQELSCIQPLDRDGEPAADGWIVFVSISMSNATQEFSRFKRIADADSEKSETLTIVDCAQGGLAMAEWVAPDAQSWTVAAQRLSTARVSPQQVQVAWIKLANKGPRGDLEEHGRKLQRDTLAVIQNAKDRFPNLRIAYLSSRIYGGYATNNLNPEPYAYESAFPAQWLIQDQINGEPALKFDAEKGDVKAPLLLWGPYLWADGTTPRESDKLVYTRSDLADDGTHSSEAGRDKVARLMLDVFKTNPLAKPWFAR